MQFQNFLDLKEANGPALACEMPKKETACGKRVPTALSSASKTADSAFADQLTSIQWTTIQSSLEKCAASPRASGIIIPFVNAKRTNAKFRVL